MPARADVLVTRREDGGSHPKGKRSPFVKPAGLLMTGGHTHKCSPVCSLELFQGLTTDLVSLELTQ